MKGAAIAPSSRRKRPLTYDLIVSQGRIADRTPGAIAGATLTAEAIERITGLRPTVVGTPDDARQDDWSLSLPQARPTLLGLEKAVSQALQRGNTPLVVANTCSASLATLPAVAREHPDLVVLWIDAHGDFNTPKITESGYLGGMVLAAACGLWDSGHGSGLDPARVILVGARDIDPAEADLLRKAGVRIVAPSGATPEAIKALVENAPIWIHVDWDVLEPNHVPAAYAVADGVLPEALRAIFQAVPTTQLAGLEVAEFEASGHKGQDDAALACLVDILAPLIAP